MSVAYSGSTYLTVVHVLLSHVGIFLVNWSTVLREVIHCCQLMLEAWDLSTLSTVLRLMFPTCACL